MDIIEDILRQLQNGDDFRVGQLTQKALENGLAPKEILDRGLLKGMAVVGDRFKAHEIFLPEVLLAARAMYVGMDLLKPLLIKEDLPNQGKVVIGTVQGDLHDIGKNLVGIMLKGAGFEVIDLGNDVAPERFIESAETHGALIIGMSALLTTTMPVMQKVAALLDKQGLRSRIRTIIGGAPVSESYAREIGADAYGFDATQAVDCIKQLFTKN